MSIIESMARRLYDHWRSSSFEAARQPEFDDAADNLRRVFEDQAEALFSVVHNFGVVSYALGYDDGGRDAGRGPA
jgi:hypothetical protein